MSPSRSGDWASGSSVEQSLIWYYAYPLAIVAGFVCGFINTLAGSGSLITLPFFISVIGLPAHIANGTNRIGILLQNGVATYSFHQQRQLDWWGGLWLSIPAVLGSIVGAQIAVNLDELAMRRAIGGLMLVMLAVMLVRPQRWLQGRPGVHGAPSWRRLRDVANSTLRRGPEWQSLGAAGRAVFEYLTGWQTLRHLVMFFGIGIYGGFIQAGVGIFLLAGLVLDAGYDLVRANAIKVLINFCLTVSALGVFVFNDQVVWDIGLVVALGNMLGAWMAARMAVQRGAVFVHRLLILVVLGSAAHLLGAFEALGRLLA